jgi:benzoate-CoA ligase family protein
MESTPISLPAQFNASEYFVDRNVDEGHGDMLAVLCQDRRLTYRQIAEEVNRAAHAFSRAGLKGLDRIVMLLSDSPAFVAAFWGAIKMGAVPIPTNTLLSSGEYEFMLRDSGACGLVVEDALLEKVASCLDRLDSLKAAWVVGGVSEKYKSFDVELAGSQPNFSAAATLRDDPAFWLYTSGSTGQPKAAIHLHLHMVVCLERYAKQVLKLTVDDRTFSTSKLFFAYGLGNGLYFPFGVGGSTVLLSERPSPGKIFEVLARYQPTLFFAVPSVYAALLQVKDVEPGVFRSVRCAVSAGEALPAPLWERFRERFGICILDGIGSTEMLHMFISNRLDDIVPGSSGRQVPGYEAKIVDEEGKEVSPGQSGDLLVRGESVSAGYWNRPELTQRTFRDGWAVTGDRYSRDERGYFWYHGRSDDMLKVRGLWVSPMEVESALLTHPAVLECAVIGVLDHDGLTKPKAFVVLKSPSSASPEFEAELAQYLRARLAGYKVPRWIVFLESLPRTATGKIQRYKLRMIAEKSGSGRAGNRE